MELLSFLYIYQQTKFKRKLKISFFNPYFYLKKRLIFEGFFFRVNAKNKCV